MTGREASVDAIARLATRVSTRMGCKEMRMLWRVFLAAEAGIGEQVGGPMRLAAWTADGIESGSGGVSLWLGAPLAHAGQVDSCIACFAVPRS